MTFVVVEIASVRLFVPAAPYAPEKKQNCLLVSCHFLLHDEFSYAVALCMPNVKSCLNCYAAHETKFSSVHGLKQASENSSVRLEHYSDVRAFVWRSVKLLTVTRHWAS